MGSLVRRSVLCFVLPFVLVTGASAANAVRSWAQPQIRLVTRAGIFSGTPATFRPTDPLTDGTLARVLAKLAGSPPSPSQGDAAPVSLEQLDRALVTTLGLRDAAYRFYLGTRRAGLHPPRRFGTEVVARLLGLRVTYPRSDQRFELAPDQTATRAEAAYSIAQILRFGPDSPVDAVKAAATAFALPILDTWQRRILSTAVRYIGDPYVWGGTGGSYGGYDCSGFVWRVYKLTSYSGEGDLASVLRGRTTMEMSGEVPRSLRIGLNDLEPGDVLFFGRGRRSKPAQVDHTAIYLGNDWLIESSGNGVAIAPFDGWRRHAFAWARRPLAEAHLT